MSELLFVGVALVDSIIRGFDPVPVSASGFRAESGTLSVGGEAVNGAMAAAKLGVSTSILCSLGQDAAGDLIVHALNSCGVRTDHIVRSAEHPTPVTTMFVADDGTRKSITNGSHRYNFHPEQYKETLRSAKAIVLGSLFRAPFDDPEVIREVVRTAKDAGCMIFADTKLPNFRKLTLDDISDILPLIDCIFPNEDEAKYYSGKENPEEMADEFLRRGIPAVTVKLGAKGCLYKDAHQMLCMDAFPVKALDATGAGDNFLAGFAVSRLEGKNTRDALSFAGACGAICTSAVGASTGLKNKAQVEEFLAQFGE